jgi:hypothetical protein
MLYHHIYYVYYVIYLLDFYYMIYVLVVAWNDFLFHLKFSLTYLSLKVYYFVEQNSFNNKLISFILT